MNEEQLKIVISADTQDFVKDVKNIQKEVKNTGKVLQDASDDVYDFSAEFDNLGKDLKSAKAEYVKVAAAFGENSKEAQEAAKKISELSLEYVDAQKDIKRLTDAADSFDNVLKNLQDEADQTAFELEQMARETEQAAKELKEAEERTEAFEAGLESAKQTCANAMKAMATAIAGAITAMVALAESTRELRNNQAKVQTAFENAGASAEQATKVYDEMFRVLGDDGQTTEAVAHLAKLTTSEKDLATWTEICTGIYAEFGASLPIESLTEAANETVKTGTVVGALADAINWASLEGENFGVTLKEATEENEEWNKAVMEAKSAEDKFNLALQQCNSEAEREKLLRETLNRVYKTSSDRYKKNNDAILKANDAQNRMNKSLSKMGDAMEPVNAELKEMGALLLEDVEDPMKDVSKFLTNSLFPAIKKTYGWLKDNLPAISSALVGMATAYVGYKAAVLATELAEKGLTVAIIAKTAAQKAFNAVMKANPIGLVATVLVSAATAMVAYEKATQYTAEEIQVLSEKEKELQQAAYESRDAFYAQLEATNKTVDGLTAQYDHTNKLADELLRLVDANGQVREADQGRVDFILGQLNNALGTEYSMVDGVIQKYDELKNNIYEVINAKTASAMLEAHNADYIAAIEAEGQAFAEVGRAEREYMAQKEEVAKLEEELEALREETIQKNIGATANQVIANNQALGEKMEQVEAEKGLLSDLETKYDEALAAYGTHYATKKQYEDAAMLVEQGKYQEAIDILKGKSDAYFEYSDDVDVATQQAVDALYKEAVDAGIAAAQTRENFENGVAGYTQEMVDEAEQGYEDALNEWANAYDDANGVGEDLGDGLSDGMEDKRSSLLSKARSIVSAIISAMRSEADSHSPSRKTIAFGEDLGEGAEIGIEKQSKHVVKASSDMVKDSLKAIQGLSGINFKHTISGSIMQANPMPALTASIDTSSTLPLLNALGDKINDNTPIILQVDGKVFAQTAVETMNRRFRQLGKVDLAYI